MAAHLRGQRRVKTAIINEVNSPHNHHDAHTDGFVLLSDKFTPQDSFPLVRHFPSQQALSAARASCGQTNPPEGVAKTTREDRDGSRACGGGLVFLIKAIKDLISRASRALAPPGYCTCKMGPPGSTWRVLPMDVCSYTPILKEGNIVNNFNYLFLSPCQQYCV